MVFVFSVQHLKLSFVSFDITLFPGFCIIIFLDGEKLPMCVYVCVYYTVYVQV